MWHFHTKHLWAVMLDVRLMLQFAAIAEERSFTRAAKRLGLAQPWLSARMRTLEDDLGSPVFQRSSRGASLTPEGERLYDALRPMLAAVAAFDIEFQELKRRRSRRIRIGCPALSAQDLKLARLFDAYEAAFPNSNLQIERGYSSSLLYALRMGRCDFIFSAATSDAELEAMPFTHHGVGVKMHRGDPLAARDRISLCDLVGRTLAVYSHSLHHEIDNYIEQAVALGVHVTRHRELHDAMILQKDMADRRLIFTITPEEFDFPVYGEAMLKPLEGSPLISVNLLRRRANQHAVHQGKFWRLAQSHRHEP